MKKFFIPRLGRRASRPLDAETVAAWQRDPLSHPALSVMGERELADLPLGRPRFAAPGCTAAASAC